MQTPRSFKILIACLVAIVAIGVFIVRSKRVFGPESSYVQPFNSDSALPVLMANDPHIDSFRTYIYGQDQIGAWPFLFAQLVRRLSGYAWTPESIFMLQVVWLALSLLLVAALCLESSWVVAVLLAATLCLHPTVSHYFFVLNQKNAWQVTALFAAWLSSRWLMEHYFFNDGRKLRGWILKAAVFLFSLLAMWMSPISTPILCGFFLLELMRAKMVGDARLSIQTIITSASPVLLAFIVEQGLKLNYHVFALEHFGSAFKTPTELDWANMQVNLQRQLAVFTSAPYWWLGVFGLVGAAVILLLMLRSKTRAILTPGLRLDLAILISGCAFAALLNFAFTVPFTWVRLNGYGPRYLAQTHMFGAFAGLLMFPFVLSLVSGVYQRRKVIFTSVAFIVALIVFIRFPPVSPNADYRTLQGIAHRLGENSERRLLLGGYWDTYVFASLTDPGRIIPLPAENQLLRTPWTARQLHDVDEVVVVQHVFAATGDVETPMPYLDFGTEPPPSITQYGVTLRLAVPRWFEQNGYSFSLYRVSR